MNPVSPAEPIYCAADAADDAGDYATAFRLFTEAAALGDVAAMARLASLFELGRGTTFDLDMSITWDLEAIDSGHLSSLFNPAVTYRRHVHIRKARHWFERSLASGDATAAIELAKLLSVSDSEEPAARDYLRRALASDNLTEANRDEAQWLLQTDLRDW
ncbi:hypothetical protein [Tahibacter sp.]|uniref:tetratricopeptide repeat protein n=1 Tax=Tahibacter sp. TaxID=2056211 RepID=UPI0028C3E13F|nr:hypothetical protein [Tahibacter sp.]